MMTNSELSLLYQKLLLDQYPTKNFTLSAEFYKSKTIRHTIELRRHQIQVRLSCLLEDTPADMIIILGKLLLAKFFRYKPDPGVRRVYNNYIQQKIVPSLPAKKLRISKQYKSAGRHYDLTALFERLNKTYFAGNLKQPILAWSLKNSYTRLGFYDADRNLLVISRILDSKKTNTAALEFLVYHEMLHIYFPTLHVNGRRKIHTAEFRDRERQFPEFHKIQKWLTKKRFRL